MGNENKTEKMFEILLKSASEEATKQEMEALPSRDELKNLYPDSEAFYERMARKIKKHERAKKIKQMKKVLYRFAASIAIIFTISVIGLMSVEASRSFILSRIIEMDNYEFTAKYRFGEISSFEVGELHFGYLPEGYELYSVGICAYLNKPQYLFMNTEGTVTLIIRYSIIDDDGWINAGGNIDPANTNFSIVSLNGQIAYFWGSLDPLYNHTIMWNQGRHFILIDAWMDADEVLKIARNIKIY